MSVQDLRRRDAPTALGSFHFSAAVKSTEARKPASIPTFGRIARGIEEGTGVNGLRNWG